MKLNELKEKKILILGFGREGMDNFLFLRKLFPNKTLGIADRLEFKNLKLKTKNYKHAKWHLGKNYLKTFKKYDVIIKSPGIPFKNIPKSERRKLTSQTEIFFDNCPGKIVGVTGTKGKSTTASMIYKILKAGGVKTHLVGNIGKPVLSFLLSSGKNNVYPAPLAAKDERVFVYELSSHQLYNLKKSPQVAVFLNLFAEHLDYYRNFKEYVRAKANITRYQKKVKEDKSSSSSLAATWTVKEDKPSSSSFAATWTADYLIFNSEDKIVRKIAEKSKAKKIPVKGEYYELDKNAARAVGKIFKIPTKIIEKAIKNFKYLPHRLELVGKFHGITFYNDALATIPEATVAAIDTLGDRVETIMLGGFDRKIDFKNLAKKVLGSKIKTVILFPTTGEKIWESIRQAQKKALRQKHPATSRIEPFFTDNMRDAVKLAYRNTRSGKICLLSTASSSFSIFKDYKEKGNLFKKYAKKFSHGKNL